MDGDRRVLGIVLESLREEYERRDKKQQPL